MGMALGVSRRDMVMIGVLLAGTLLAVLNQTLLSPALPAIMASLEVDATTVQWLTSGYSLVEAVIIPLSAFLMADAPFIAIDCAKAVLAIAVAVAVRKATRWQRA
jgi:MFS family permease